MSFPYPKINQLENSTLLAHGFFRWRQLAIKAFRGALLVASAIVSLSVAMAAPSQGNGNPRQTTKDSPALLREAESLLRDGRFDDAKRKIQQELGRNPSSVNGYNLLGIIYTEEKDYANAIDAFQYALKLDPNSLRSRNNLGSLYVTQQKFDLAEKEFRAVLRSAPSNRDANYNLGLLLIAQSSPTKAIPYLRRVRPADLEARFSLARAYLQAGRLVEGLKLATELSSERQGDVRLHFTLGALLASEKQYRGAQRELEKANALQPESWEILYNLGQAYLRSGEFDKAEVVLSRALKLKTDSPETLYVLAQTFAEQDKAVDALDLLSRAHKLAPNNADILLLLARVSMTQNYFEDAIPLLQSGLLIAPQRADLHAALGESYFISGKPGKAIEEFKTLLGLDPSARSYAFMGLSYRHLGRLEEARKYFREGLRKEPNNASCLFNMGYIEGRQGNYSLAETFFQQALRASPDFAEALLELANLRVAEKRLEEAAAFLRRYIKVSHEPASGYYKLAMIERSLHQTEASERDLNLFQTLSRNTSAGSLPYQHLFAYLENRSRLSPQERAQVDLAQITEEVQKHPDQRQGLYLLAETFLKLGRSDDARKTIAQLDQLSAGDYRTQTGIGVLLARYRFYDEAIQHFQTALHVNPDSDDVKFDLADAYFRKGQHREALVAAQQISADGRQDDTYLALIGDIYAHLGDAARATDIFRGAIARNPDNDQYYLSLTLAQLRENDLSGAEATLKKGLARIPSSGKIHWGLGLVSVLKGNAAQAAERFERAVDLLPEWSGSYSTLGIFYYQTGQIEKAREVLDRFKGSGAAGILDVNRIEDVLTQAPQTAASNGEPIPMPARQQIFQLALSVAERTL